ncbi:UNVERIFIED_CONTAM: hypothetical protein FKN15_044097 [Acipenser sinensis]
MSSEKSVPGERAQEAELQVEMKKTPVSQITHFAEDTTVSSSERTLDATPIIPNPEDQDKPQGPADTSPVTSTASGPNIPEIAEDTAPATSTAQGHSIPKFEEDESPVTCIAPAHNILEITGDTTPVMGPSDTSSVISTPPDGAVPEDPANSPSTTPASVSPPGEIKIDSVESDSVSLSWGRPDNMDGIPHSFCFTYSSSDRSHQDSITARSNSTVISDLIPGREYSFTVTTDLVNGIQSTPVSTSVCTKTHLENLLCKLGLENYFPGKITLSTVLEIGIESITDEPIQSLKKTSLVLSEKCHDGSFLQQEMMLKMSMCQFAVPLLLPDCSTNQCTLMLWAMRDIVKKFRPRSLADSKGFVEDSIVSTAMPMISFVRLGDCSLSKSQILNKVLSNPQQYHDFFIHRDMECGDVRQRIANGLVEICWYLPCGKNNLDIFPEPVAVANLRGDLLSFQKQFSILCQTSSAVFIFFDSIAESECNLLSSAGNIKAQLFLVAKSKTHTNVTTMKELASKLKLKGNAALFKDKINDADFVTNLRSNINRTMENSPYKITVEQMSDVARELGIPVDEDCTECQNS